MLTPTSSLFASLEYVTKPRSTTSEEPAIAVNTAEISPHVTNFSAVASVMSFARQAARSVSASASKVAGIMLDFPAGTEFGPGLDRPVGKDGIAMRSFADRHAGGPARINGAVEPACSHPTAGH